MALCTSTGIAAVIRMDLHEPSGAAQHVIVAQVEVLNSDWGPGGRGIFTAVRLSGVAELLWPLFPQ